MTVYVDPLFTMQPRTAQARSHGDRWCHMQVGRLDDIEELHLMAERIGLKRSYYQVHKLYPHYDLTPAKRALAIKHGAIEVDHTQRRELCCRSSGMANWKPKEVESENRTMMTSNFANNQRFGLNGISISRWPDRRSGFDGPEFTLLMPSSQLLNWYKSTSQDAAAWEQYTEAYNAQLDCLNFAAVYEELKVIADSIDADEIVLLCYESAKTLDTNPCHRRLVAARAERELGIVAPEWRKAA